MKRIHITLLIVVAVAVCAPRLAQAQSPAGDEIFRQEGIASWYGSEFDGRPTASGEIFNSSLYTAAHPTLPFGTVLTVTNRHNNKKVTVKVNDRGPFVSARIIDLSRAAAEDLDMLTTGTAPVLIESAAAIAAAVQPAQPAPAAQPPVAPVAQSPVAPVAPATPAVPAPATPVTQPTIAAVPAPQPAAPEPYIAPPAPVAPAPVATVPAPAATIAPIRAPAPIQRAPATLIPAITPSAAKVYRLQVGSYHVAKNAVDTFDKLKSAGLSPAYERYEDFFRVVLAGIRGYDVYSILEKLGTAGFREALIREEN